MILLNEWEKAKKKLIIVQIALLGVYIYTPFVINLNWGSFWWGFDMLV